METLREMVRLSRMGYSARRISKLTGASRNTVRKYLECFEEAGVLAGSPIELPAHIVLKELLDKQHPRQRPAQEKSSILDYRAEIKLALKKSQSPTHIHGLLTTKYPEFTDSLSAVKRMVAGMREPSVRARVVRGFGPSFESRLLMDS